MQTISTIIDQLTISENSLSTPLLETKVLAVRIKNEELLRWVDQEIEGYDADAELPNYRISTAILKGSYINGRMKVTDTVLPIPVVSDDLLNLLTTSRIRQSCSALEYLLKAGQERGVIAHTLNGNILQLLQSLYAEQNPYFSLFSANMVTSVSVVFDMLSTIRSKLLDLMLKLEAEFGDAATVTDLKNGNKMINNYIQNIVFNNGSGNIINTGDSSTLTSI